MSIERTEFTEHLKNDCYTIAELYDELKRNNSELSVNEELLGYVFGNIQGIRHYDYLKTHLANIRKDLMKSAEIYLIKCETKFDKESKSAFRSQITRQILDLFEYCGIKKEQILKIKPGEMQDIALNIYYNKTALTSFKLLYRLFDSFTTLGQ